MHPLLQILCQSLRGTCSQSRFASSPPYSSEKFPLSDEFGEEETTSDLGFFASILTFSGKNLRIGFPSLCHAMAVMASG